MLSSIIIIASALLSLLFSGALAFQMPPTFTNVRVERWINELEMAATARAFREEKPKSHFLLDKFTTYNGELIQPYNILGIDREADRREVRTAYIELSKTYHPDAIRHRDVLPGSCTSFEDAREEWERIKLAYEILSDRKTRLRYDRAEVISDPSAALKRAAGKDFMVFVFFCDQDLMNPLKSF